jgi:protein-L-isoaspartate(D-aspartate) O-methyltransferase
VLSHLAGDVVTLERFRMLAEQARERLASLGCRNVEVVVADGCSIPDELGHFDRILVTVALSEIPAGLVERLLPDGILVAPVGPHSGPQALVRLRKTGDGVDRAELIEVRFVPALPGVAREM